MADVTFQSNSKGNRTGTTVTDTHLRRIIDTIPVLAWCNRPDGSNEFLNQRWQDYTGLSQDEASGWGWKVTFHPDDLDPLMERWRTLLSSGESGEIESRLRRYDGVFRWFLIRVEPLRDELGNIVRWYGTSTDIRLFPPRSLTLKGVSMSSWLRQSPDQRRADAGLALQLAQTPALFQVAERYSPSRIADAVAHVDRAGRAGVVLIDFSNNRRGR